VTAADSPSGTGLDESGDPLVDALADLGVPTAEIEQAKREGVLELLALERLVAGEVAHLDLAGVVARTGLQPDQIRTYWRALGFPDPRPGETLFVDADAEMLATVAELISEGSLESDIALQMARVIGSSVSRIATAQVDATLAGSTAIPEIAADAELHGDLGQAVLLMPEVMEYVWRRHLAHAARRRMTRGLDEGQQVCVGFADLVGFTAQTQQLDERDLADVVARFEALAYDVVATHGGRVIKMIGDEVMFLHDDVHAGAHLALDLADAYRDEEALSDVRVGLAAGPVLERDGDVYGHTVNLASRIVSVAYPATVVVSEEVRDALVEDGDIVLTSLHSHHLRDIGRVPLWRVRRVEDDSEAPYRKARQRRAARRGILRERWAEVREEARVISVGLVGAGDSLEPTTSQIAALTDAVLDTDLDHEVQVELLADLEVARRLHQLEQEAEARAGETDIEAERKLAEIEAETRSKVEAVEREARRRVERLLEEAEERSRRVEDDAGRKIERVVRDTERKADRAERDAEREAERIARRRAKEREAEERQAEDRQAEERPRGDD